MLNESDKEKITIKNKDYIERMEFDLITHERVEELKREMMSEKNRYEERYALTDTTKEDEKFEILLKEDKKLMDVLKEDKEYFEDFIEKILKKTYKPIEMNEDGETNPENEDKFYLDLENLNFRGRKLKFDNKKYKIVNEYRWYFYLGDIEEGTDTGLIYTSSDNYIITSPIKNNDEEIGLFSLIQGGKTYFYTKREFSQVMQFDIHLPIEGKNIKVVNQGIIEMSAYIADQFIENVDEPYFFVKKQTDETGAEHILYGEMDRKQKMERGVHIIERGLPDGSHMTHKYVGRSESGIMTESWVLMSHSKGEEALNYTKIDPVTKLNLETRNYLPQGIHIFYAPSKSKKNSLEFETFKQNYNDGMMILCGEGYCIYQDNKGNFKDVTVGFHVNDKLVEGFTFNDNIRSYGSWELENETQEENKVSDILQNYTSFENNEENIELNSKITKKFLAIRKVFQENYKAVYFKGLSEYYKEKQAMYFGSVVEDFSFGYGEYKDSEGNFYKGNFKKGLRNGKGEMHLKNGDTYKGEFKNDNFEGFAEYFSKEAGETYKGEFRNGFFHGKGTYYQKDGTVIKGNYIRGKMEGFARLVDPHGSILEGEFKKDKLVRGISKTVLKQAYVSMTEDAITNGDYLQAGYLMLKSASPLPSLPFFKKRYRKYGIEYEGEFFNDVFHGNGELFDLFDIRYKGKFRNGIKEGHGVQTYPDGIVYKGNFEADFPNGMGKLILVNGDQIIGTFKAEKHLMCDGVLVKKSGETIRGIFKDGKLHERIDDDDNDPEGGNSGGRGMKQSGGDGRDQFVGWNEGVKLEINWNRFNGLNGVILREFYLRKAARSIMPVKVKRLGWRLKKIGFRKLKFR